MAAPSVHHHHHGHPQQNGGSKLKFAFWLNLLFCLFELAGGIYTNSVAILSDALHDLGDSLSLGLAWYFEKISGRKPDHHFHFGYRRFSVLGALINSLVLIIGSVFILKEAVERIAQPEPSDAQGMIWLAIAGVLVNGVAAWRLHGGKSLNERVVSLHLLEDVLGWVAILAGALIMQFYDVPVLDPLLSIGICLFVLLNVYRNNREVYRVMLQGKPTSLQMEEIRDWMLQESSLQEIHALRIWSLDNQEHVMSVHLVVDPELEGQALASLKKRIREGLRKRFSITHATLETENAIDGCSENLEEN